MLCIINKKKRGKQLLLTKQIEVKITKSNLNYFLEKGYQCNLKDKIKISPYDLQPQSDKEIEYKCDNCGKIIKLAWSSYLKKKEKEYSEWGDFCSKCAKAKRADWFKKNKKEEYEKIYLEARSKAKQTCLKKYGCENVMQNPDFKNKMKKSVQRKYGVDNVMQLSEVREKIALTLGSKQELESFISENGKKYYRYRGIPCSSNQLHLNELLGGELNGYISYYPVDLLFEEDKIYLEYNGTGHNLSVKKGKISKEEQDKKRNKKILFFKE